MSANVLINFNNMEVLETLATWSKLSSKTFDNISGTVKFFLQIGAVKSFGMFVDSRLVFFFS